VNQERKPDTNFEQRLLAQLRAVVAERGVAGAAAEASAVTPAWRRPSPRLALAAAGALAALVVGILVVSSGPSAETAAATVLRQTATVAAAGTSDSTPGPGEFLYTKTKRLELQEWAPGSYTGSFGAISPKPKGAFSALNTWQEEEWWSPDGPSRSRWVMGTPQFLSDAEQDRWERAGSPLPGSFDCDRRCFPEADIIELRPGVTDVEYEEGPRFPDFSALPTEPKALRLEVEQRQTAGPINTGQVIAELWDILDKPNTTPELRAAIFGALAELPGIELDRGASNLVGRSGYALGYESTDSSSYGEQRPGKRVEYIFDPETSAILGRRETIVDPEKLLPWAKGIAAGTVWREVAYLQSQVVDSTREGPDERE
jgi:hypothetical protein